jgi:hypothetical protein
LLTIKPLFKAFLKYPILNSVKYSNSINLEYKKKGWSQMKRKGGCGCCSGRGCLWTLVVIFVGGLILRENGVVLFSDDIFQIIALIVITILVITSSRLVWNPGQKKVRPRTSQDRAGE